MFDGAHSPNPDCIVTIAAAANGVGLCFVRGAGLPDPDKVLTVPASRLALFAFPPLTSSTTQPFESCSEQLPSRPRPRFRALVAENL